MKNNYKAVISSLEEPVIPSLIPPQISDDSSFSPMLQGTGTNRLAQLSTRKTTPEIDEITGLATITSGNLTVFIDKFNSLTGGLRISTHKLLDACTIQLTSQNHYRGNGELNTLVVISLEEYMLKCGIPLTKSSTDKTRRKVKEDLESLYNTSIEWSEPSSGKIKDFAKMRICDAISVKNGRIIMNFSKAITSYLTHAYVMQYPVALLKLDERNPSSYHLGRKLLVHHGIDNNKEKGTNEILSVKVLLSNAPEIPKYEEVMSKDRHLEKRIILPFQNALDSLKDILVWEYCNKKGVKLSKKQLENFSYSVFIESFIKFNVTKFPARNKK